VILLTVRRLRDAEKVLSYVEESRPKTLVRVFDQAAAERIRAFGGVPVESARAASEAFMEWFSVTFRAEQEEAAPRK
jgi:hypothetical protein